jgi:hypothetical protein
MSTGKGFKSATLRFGTEDSAWGTSVTPDKIIVMTEDGLDNDLEKLKTAGINTEYHDIDDVKVGGVVAAGTFGFEMRYQGMETLLAHAMGKLPATTEQASFTIDGTNNKIDFKEDAGSELTATLTSGSYIMGADSSVVGSLCEDIKTQLEVAGTGTYTITFSNITKLLTIAVAGAIAAVQVLPVTGTNTATSSGPTIGFAADSSSAGSILADTVVVTVFSHAFTLSSEVFEGLGLTLEKDVDISAFTYEGCKINTMEMSLDPKDYLKVSMSAIAKDVDKSTATAGLTLPTAKIPCSTQIEVKYGNPLATVIANKFTLSLDNKLQNDDYKLGTTLIAEPARTDKREVTGSINLDFTSTDQYDDFRNAATIGVNAVFTGALIKVGHNYSITVDIGQAQLMKGLPLIEGPGKVKTELPFEAFAQDSSDLEFTITIVNTLSAVV